MGRFIHFVPTLPRGLPWSPSPPAARRPPPAPAVSMHGSTLA